LNLGFNAAGFLGAAVPGFGAFIFNNIANPADPLNGLTVSQILAIANQVLAGTAPVPAGYTLVGFTALLEKFASAYEGCTPSAFAIGFLNPPVP